MNTDQIKSSAALFEHFEMPEQILRSLTKNNFINPTPIQQEALPVALKGLDILGSAQTGTGKTLAFAIPLLARLTSNAQESALIVVPTRELAMQVQQALQTLIGHDLRIATALLIGGEPIFKQFRQLRMQPRIVVGTPGRIIDHLEQGTYNPKNVAFLVLDEMDRMFDMGFDLQVAEIIRHLPAERQTMMFSATLPKEVEVRAQKYLKNPVRIAVGPTSTPAANITQEVVHVHESGKYDALVLQLNQREGAVIVFVKTKMGAAYLADRLNDENHGALAMHGDLRQKKREQVVQSFRKGRQRILVATDVAARGLDIPHIQHVINYDLPQCPEDYIHRIGRTARAGASGAAVCLIAPHERHLWSAIDRLLNPGKQVESDRQGGSSFNRRSGGSSSRFGNRRGSSNGRSRSFGGGEFNKSSHAGFGRKDRRFNSDRNEQRSEYSSRRSSGDYQVERRADERPTSENFIAERSSIDSFKKRNNFDRERTAPQGRYADSHGQSRDESNRFNRRPSSSRSSFGGNRSNGVGFKKRDSSSISFFDTEEKQRSRKRFNNHRDGASE